MAKFYSFQHGSKMSDSFINLWLTEMQKEVVVNGKLHWDCSCGDAMASVHVYDSLINVSIATSQGYTSIKFYSKTEFRDWIPNFSRSGIFGSK